MDITNKRKIYYLFSVAIITLVCAYLPLLLDLIANAINIFGNFEILFFSILKCILYIIYLIIFVKHSKKITYFTPFVKKEKPLSLKQLLAIYFITLIAIFFVSFTISFNLNVTYMLGFHTTMSGAVNLVSEMVSYGFRMFLTLIAMAYIQEVFEIILDKKIIRYIPYGAIFIFLTTGLIEFFYGTAPVNLILWICNLAYGVLYLVSDKRLFVSFFSFIFIFLF